MAAIVLDNGGSSIKAGWNRDDKPCCVLPTVTGLPKVARGRRLDSGQKTLYVGAQALSRKKILKLQAPIEHGVVTDWVAMEAVWREALGALGLDGCVGNNTDGVLMTEAPLNPLKNRHRAAQVWFETFETPALFVCTAAVLALYGTGRVTGLAVDCGHGVSTVAAMFDGYTIPHATQRQNLGGHHLTDLLAQMVMERGHLFATLGEKVAVQQMKHDHCFVSLDYTNEHSNFSNNDRCEVTLPDGSKIRLGPQRIRCPELLFSPALFAQFEEHRGIVQMLDRCLKECANDSRAALLSSVVLTGGCALLPQYSKRFDAELKKMVPLGCKVNIVAPPEPMTQSWVGGSLLTALSTFEDSWISRGEWHEEGNRILHQKCTNL